MAVLGALLATAFALALVVVQPVRGRARYRRLVEQVATDPRARLDHYRRGITAEWLAVGIVVTIGLVAGHDAASIGVRAVDHASDAWAQVPVFAILLAASTVVLRRPAMRAALRRQAGGFLALLPTTRDERLTFVPLAITAGICEEVLYRGFLAAYVGWLAPSATSTEIVVVTSIAFGLAHLYQGPIGIVVTGVLGAVLGFLVVDGGSLYPAMAVHALIDLRIVLLPDLRTPEAETTSTA